MKTKSQDLGKWDVQDHTNIKIPRKLYFNLDLENKPQTP